VIERREQLLNKIGNIVPDSVPVSDNEDDNAIIRSFALDKVPGTDGKEFKTVKELDSVVGKTGKLSHVDLVPMLGLADTEKGTAVAGNRGYYLVGDGVLLNQALISCGPCPCPCPCPCPWPGPWPWPWPRRPASGPDAVPRRTLAGTAWRSCARAGTRRSRRPSSCRRTRWPRSRSSPPSTRSCTRWAPRSAAPRRGALGGAEGGMLGR
jgi:hypothetical protein